MKITTRHTEAASGSATHAAPERLRAILALKRRRYNRLYMRRWRANPVHRRGDLLHRREWHYARKVRGIEDRIRRIRLCGFCGVRRSIAEISRLEISQTAPDGYVTVHVPTCGQC